MNKADNEVRHWVLVDDEYGRCLPLSQSASILLRIVHMIKGATSPHPLALRSITGTKLVGVSDSSSISAACAISHCC